MPDYKNTLNLPKTEFPMKANLAAREPKLLQTWLEKDIYNQIRKARAQQKKFILHDGPLYANGHTHLGHAFNKILKDIVVKSKTMSGFDSPYIPGWDCHGLPIELNVEKKVGKAGSKISAADFRKQCRAYASKQVDIQRQEFKRLGVFGEWDNPYLTMNPLYEANIVRSLAKIIERGHLHPGYKPVHWCLDCRSALAEAEVEYYDKKSPAIDVRFSVLDEEALLDRLSHSPNGKGEGQLSVPIWTTTPWTLPANEAVAVNPNIEYVLLQCHVNDTAERFLLAEPLVTTVMTRYGIEDHRVLAYGPGRDLEGLLLQHPFYDREVPIVLGDHVTVDAGTGNVHTAPAHGQDDYVVAQKYDLPIKNPVANNGCFLSDVDTFAGEHVLKANDHIIEILNRKGKLIHTEVTEHSYPHCWRHKTPVIFRATHQWFISMDNNGLRRDAIDAIFKIKWIPDWGQRRITSMIENRPDWCISRQRVWGTPITLFVHNETDALHPKTPELMEQVAKLIEKEGIEAWFALDPRDLLGNEAKDYTKVTDTLDVWFDSGVSHTCVVKQHPELHYPANLYLEGSDQHRGWFQTSLLSAIAMYGHAPYQEVLTHGFTVDELGRKMSKSLGNVVAPDKIMKTYGADILRLWVAATDYRSELSFSDEIIKRIADTYRRMRNTARFLLSNLFDFDPEKQLVNTADMLALDRFICDKAHTLQKQIQTAYDEYQFHLVYQKVHHFCSVDLGGFYLDIIKDRQYTTATNSLARRSCQTAMFYLIETLVRWFAPILSFTAEEIWQYIPGVRDGSVFLATWYEKIPTLGENEVIKKTDWDIIIDVRNAVNKAIEEQRNVNAIRSGLSADVTLYCDNHLKQLLSALQDELRFVLITSSALVQPLDQKPADATATDSDSLYLTVTPSPNPKCIRCWHHRKEIGSNKQHPELCDRCIENISGDGEKRLFA